MATMNRTAVKNTMNGLTNQEALTSIFKRLAEIHGLAVNGPAPLQSESVDLAVAILDNPEANELVEWITGFPTDDPSEHLGEGRRLQYDEVSAMLAELITAVRMQPIQPPNGVTFSSPPAKVLPWPAPPAA
jgi:hypothetical protein